MESTSFDRSRNNAGTVVTDDDQHGSSSLSTTASSKQGDHLEALALLNDDNALKVTLNETHVKFISAEWLTEEDGGRAAGSILAKQLLGTKEGLQGSVNLTIAEEFVPVFDTLLIWLSMGDKYLQVELTEENASLLVGLAQYFGLEKLEEAILAEQVKREEEEAKQKQEEGCIRCFDCGEPTTVAPTYKGKTPRCWDCRDDRCNYEDEIYDDDYYDDYSDDDYSWSSW